MARVRRLLIPAALVGAALLLGAASPVQAGSRVSSCGGSGQLACTLIQAIPSCDRFLYENVESCGFLCLESRCRDSRCGDAGERACTPFLDHGWPDLCKAGNFAWLGSCYDRDGDGYPSWCGDAGEDACSIDLQVFLGVSSCKPGLFERPGLPVGSCHGLDDDGYPDFCGDGEEDACSIDLQAMLGIEPCKPGVDHTPGLPIGSCRFVAEPEPDLGTDVVVVPPEPGGPIVGIADLHLHVLAHLGFGGKLFQGAPFDEDHGVKGALHSCANGHGPGGLGDLIGSLAGELPYGHDTEGWQDFAGWPHWNSVNHQQVYWRWLERAHRGGLRLIVMLAVSNEALCSAGARRAGFGCDDMEAVDRQLAAARELVAFADAQAGGPGEGFLRIVESPAQARAAIEAGQLAVVLGIEVDSLFGCKPGQCSAAGMLADLDAYRARGVRHVFPVHIFDNAFAGAAVYHGEFFDIGNKLTTGDYYDLRDCGDEGYEFKLSFDSSTPWATIFGPLYPPAPPAATAHCNARGLTGLGETLVQGLMDRKLVIDTDHMSHRTVEAVLDAAKARSYPLVSGHGGYLEIARGKEASEYQRSEAQLRRLRDLGGMLAPLLFQPDRDGIAQWGGKVKNDCSHSAKSWAQAYLYAADQMAAGPFLQAVGLGSDLNGFIAHPAPRYGPDACAGDGAAQPASQRVAYPFPAHEGAGSFSQLSTGTRSWSVNTDGFANVGLLPDFVAELGAIGLSRSDLAPLFHSAEAYIAMWERIEAGAPECADGDDDDHDGLVDLSDPGCAGAGDLSERDAAVACDNGRDDDGDGHVDVGEDPGCESAAGATEAGACESGILAARCHLQGMDLALRAASAGDVSEKLRRKLEKKIARALSKLDQAEARAEGNPRGARRKLRGVERQLAQISRQAERQLAADPPQLGLELGELLLREATAAGGEVAAARAALAP